MNPIFKNRKGFTLIELVLAVAFLVIALTLGFSLYNFTNSSFLMAETYTNIQREMRMAASYVSSELRLVYDVELANVSDKNDYYDENFHCLYLNNGSIIHRYKEQETNNFINKTVLDGRLDNVHYNIVFSKATNEEGNQKGNIIAFLLTVDEIDYQIDSSIIAQNLIEGQEIEDPDNLNNAQYIYYRKLRAVDEEEADDSSPGKRRCFIATAAYGSYQAPAVMILRDFRDHYLLTNSIGRRFVDFYYTFSPPIAEIIGKNEILRVFTRIMLSPLVAIAYMTVVQGGVLISTLTFGGCALVFFLWKHLKGKTFVKH